MEAIRLNTTIQKDGEIFLKELPWKKGQKIEVILLIQSSPSKDPNSTNVKANQLLESELVGIWEKREDLENSSSFARQLREKAQNRGEQK